MAADAFGTISCIGTGAMGSALMRAVVRRAGAENVLVSDAEEEKARAFAASCGCTAVSNREAAERAGFLFLAVKPAVLPALLAEISGWLQPSCTVVSMAAGVPAASVRAALRGNPVVRIMPNVAASCGCGMTAVSAGADVPPEKTGAVCDLLSASGRTEIVPESLMDAVTGVSGSGPAFGFVFIDAMADAAVRLGMPRAQALVFAAQTLKGAAELVLAGGHPAVLKDAVCSPAGTTIEGIAALEGSAFRAAVIRAVTAAGEKSASAGKSVSAGKVPSAENSPSA